MIVYIRKKGDESGWVCKIGDDVDLTCFEFYVLNGMWDGLFVGGTVEILALSQVCDGEYEVLVDHPDSNVYYEYHKEQCRKHGKFIPYNELNSDEPF